MHDVFLQFIQQQREIVCALYNSNAINSTQHHNIICQLNKFEIELLQDKKKTWKNKFLEWFKK